MHGHGPGFVADLALVLAVAGVVGIVARRLNQPTILAYLLAGFVVGPYLPVPLFADAERVETLAEFGVVLVMFAIGVEFSIGKLIRVMPTSGVTGLIQVGFLAWCGFAVALAMGASNVEAIFIAGALSISSTMVVTGIFAEGSVSEDVRTSVLGVLVIQDVLAIVLIAALTGVASGGGLEMGALLIVLSKLGAVLLGLLGVGLMVVPRLVRRVYRMGSRELLVVFVVGLCFGIGHLAELLGYSVALGAFVAGVLVAESGKGERIEHLIVPLRDVFAAVFFVSIGMSFNPSVVVSELPTALALTAVVIFGHLLSVTTAGILSGSGLRRSLASALALGQIGEFAFIIAGLGISAGVVRREVQPILLTVAVLTAFTTPLAVRYTEPILRFVDHKMPSGFHRVVGLYEQWFARLRSRSAAGTRSRAAGAIRLALIDAAVAVLLLAFGLTWFEELRDALAGLLTWSTGSAGALIGVALVLLILPLLYGLAKNVLVLSSVLADAVIATGASSSERRVVRRIVRDTVHITATLAMGVPAAAILRPELPAPIGLPIVLALAGAFLYALLRDAGGLESELRSGAERMARELARRSRHDSSTDLVSVEVPVPSSVPAEVRDGLPFPGFEAVQLWTVPEGSWAASSTLANLDLRAATGVVILTIQRPDGLVTLPTGTETIRSGDVLGLWGAPAAMEHALRLLEGGATEAEKEPDALRSGPLAAN
ncbi:MAG: cation:proton antiporter [Myxococcota bacterium]